MCMKFTIRSNYKRKIYSLAKICFWNMIKNIKNYLSTKFNKEAKYWLLITVFEWENTQTKYKNEKFDLRN